MACLLSVLQFVFVELAREGFGSSDIYTRKNAVELIVSLSDQGVDVDGLSGIQTIVIQLWLEKTRPDLSPSA